MLTPQPSSALDSYIVFGAGPVNQSMGGAGTAVGVSPLTTIMWNPATGGDLDELPKLELAVEVVGAQAETSSRIPLPGGGFSEGTVESDLDIFPPLPYVGLVLPSQDDSVTYQFGAMPMFGFGVDYPADTRLPPDANLLLAPPPTGLGAVESFHAMERFSFGASKKMNDTFAVGGALIGGLGFLKLQPGVLTSPNDANGDGVFTYPQAGLEQSPAYGFQFGVQARVAERVTAGASYQSTLWTEDYSFNGEDEAGQRQEYDFDLDVPAIWSAGVGVEVTEKTLIAADVRFIPFSETEGFEEEGFDQTGALKGLGFDDIWTFKLGVQHMLTEKTTVRAGYSFAENAVPDRNAFYGIPAPVIAEHHVTAGFSRILSSSVTLNIAGWYAFENEQTGPVYGPGGATVPGAEVRNSVEAYSVSAGITWSL